MLYEDLAREISEILISSYDSKVYFHDLLLGCLRRVYYKKLMDNQPWNKWADTKISNEEKKLEGNIEYRLWNEVWLFFIKKMKFKK